MSLTNNFKNIKDSIVTEILKRTLKSKEEGKKLLKKYIKLITEDKKLKKLIKVYHAIENNKFKEKPLLIEYVNMNLSELNGYSESDFDNSIEKLKTFLIENKIDIESDLSEDILFENIKNYTINKNNKKLLIECINNICEEVLTNDTDKNVIAEETDIIPTTAFLKIATKKFNEKYRDLNEEEKKLLSIIIENDTNKKINFLEELKSDCKKLIEENYKNNENDGELLNLLKEANEVIENSEFYEDTFNQTAINLISLKNSLK
jgi:hypothetical protein